MVVEALLHCRLHWRRILQRPTTSLIVVMSIVIEEVQIQMQQQTLEIAKEELIGTQQQ
jgi:hypothetical protein